MKKKICNYFVLVMFVCSLTSLNVFAEGFIEISSSPNPVGSGARALGMGGAFIGVADDATAASWNPGGLVQLGNPEISFVLNGVHRIEDNEFGNNPEANGSQTITQGDLNYLSIVYPFNVFNRNMVISLNYQNLYDFSREWDFPLVFSTDLGFTSVSTRDDIHYDQSGNLAAIGLAYCIQFVPKFSFGFTINFWNNDIVNNEWESDMNIQRTVSSTMPGFNAKTYFNINEKYTYKGFNFNFGMLWRITEKLTTGLVFKSPFTADLTHENTRYIKNEGIGSVDMKPVTTVTDEEMDMPMSYGIGFAYRFSDKFTLSADIYRTEWGDLKLKDAAGNEKSPVTGNNSDVDPTHQIRFGGEYLFIHPTKDFLVPLRLGIFYDPAPSEGNPDDIYGFSAGSGLTYGRFIFDVAYQFRFGNNVGSSLIRDYNFNQDLKEHMIYTSFIVHF